MAFPNKPTPSSKPAVAPNPHEASLQSPAAYMLKEASRAKSSTSVSSSHTAPYCNTFPLNLQRPTADGSFPSNTPPSGNKPDLSTGEGASRAKKDIDTNMLGYGIREGLQGRGYNYVQWPESHERSSIKREEEAMRRMGDGERKR